MRAKLILTNKYGITMNYGGKQSNDTQKNIYISILYTKTFTKFYHHIKYRKSIMNSEVFLNIS